MTFPDRLATNFELVKQVPSNKPFDVFLVKDRTKDLRLCVLRLIPDSLSANKAIVDAFMAYFSQFSEIINRAYIPTVYSVSGQVGGNVYVLEEQVSGIDLTTFIKSKRNTPDFNKEIISVIGKVCEALHHAHQKDLFHLAITPEDILIDTSTGRVKLVGFGAQVFAQLNKMGVLSAQARKTIAPEVLTGAPLRPRADVYSLAKIINDICPEVFAGSDVLFKALSNDPLDRYQQARDFEGALINVLEDINKAARSRNMPTSVEAKGGLKPVLTEKPVTVEWDVYQPPPRAPDTHQPQPPIKPDSVPVMPEPETPKSISMKVVAAIAAGLIVVVVGTILYVSPGNQKEIAKLKDAVRMAALDKDRNERENREKELELERFKKEQQKLPSFAWNYPKDVKNLFIRAKAGDTVAQLSLAKKYAKDDVLPRDDIESLKWYRKAADQENLEAQLAVMDMYKKRLGVGSHDAEAFDSYLKAANQGQPLAQHNLGNMFTYGRGVPKDLSEAVKWFRKAADQGYARAQYNLGRCYKNGYGVPKDFFEAVKWYRKAADHGNASAQTSLGYCYKKGEGVPKDFTEAVRLYRKAADQGHARAQYNLGNCYDKGEGVPKDLSEAVKWYRKAADQGYASAQYNLALGYEQGEGVPADLSEAVNWLKKAAAQDHQRAKDKLLKIGVSP